VPLSSAATEHQQHLGQQSLVARNKAGLKAGRKAGLKARPTYRSSGKSIQAADVQRPQVAVLADRFPELLRFAIAC
jgi:hypothetical protein